jgi:hypothetical protein
MTDERKQAHALALAHHAQLDIKQGRMGCAPLDQANLTIQARLREVDCRVRDLLVKAEMGVHPPVPQVFTAVAHLCALAQVLMRAETVDVAAGQEAA